MAFMHMRQFVNDTRERLMFDMMRVIALQDQVRTFAEIADELDTAAARAMDQEVTTRDVRGNRGWYSFLGMIGLDTAAASATDQEAATRIVREHRRWYGFLKMIGALDFDDWMTEQRLQLLESMAPIYQGYIKYLSDAEVELGSALLACDSLVESLLAEESAVRRGMRPSEWVLEQPRVLERGAAALAQKLKAWDVEKTRLTKQIHSQL